MARREERAVTVPVGDAAEGLVLDALYVAPDPALEDAGGAVIAPPHPLYGGSMDSPVVAELSWALSRGGLATLRFDWRGVGASAGRPSGDAEDARADYAAALDQLAESVSGRLVAAGYSFGAAAAVRASAQTPRVRALVLVAPPPAMLDRKLLAARPLDVLILAGERDGIAPAAELDSIARELTRARVVTIAQADHFFGAGLGELGRAVTQWAQAWSGVAS
jgi:alpha/beta superfamily hydrolase